MQESDIHNDQKPPHEGGGHHVAEVEVSVVTTSGTYPKHGQEKVKVTEIVADFLAEAKKHLRLTDTTNWIVTVGGNEVKQDQTFGQNGLQGKVTLQWGPREGGGG